MSLLKKTGKGLGDVIPGLGNLTFDADIGKVFVTSGTGVIGYRVAASKLLVWNLCLKFLRQRSLIS